MKQEGEIRSGAQGGRMEIPVEKRESTVVTYSTASPVNPAAAAQEAVQTFPLKPHTIKTKSVSSSFPSQVLKTLATGGCTLREPSATQPFCHLRQEVWLQCRENFISYTCIPLGVHVLQGIESTCS